MPKDREMTYGDAQDIVKAAVRKVVNFQGEINVGDELGWLYVDSDNEIEFLKDWIIGKQDIEAGVTKFYYRLNRNYLSTTADDSTVGDVAKVVHEKSIPEMNYRRAMIVVMGCAAQVVGHAMVPPDPTWPLEHIGVDVEKIDDFKQRIVQDPFYGVNRFRRVINPQDLVTVDPHTPIGILIDILKAKSVPMF